MRWSADGGQSYGRSSGSSIPWPPGTVHEVEEYQVPLQGVTHVELCIVPDIQEGDAYATLEEMRLQ